MGMNNGQCQPIKDRDCTQLTNQKSGKSWIDASYALLSVVVVVRVDAVAAVHHVQCICNASSHDVLFVTL